MTWTPAFPLAELGSGQARLFKSGSHRVAVFHLGHGEVFAVDNACPHEGYPLVQGEVRDRVLTCAWHNFKFDLGSGACLKGDEDVRNYPTRVVDGVIEVDLTAEDPSRRIEAARASLQQAVLEGQAGRMARDVVRLLHAGVPGRAILADAAALDARHAEYGTTHATPVATDLIGYLDGTPENDTLVIALALELVSDASLRRPARQWPVAIRSGDFEDELSRAVEAEEVDRALGLVRGGLGEHDVGAALLRCASEHFLGFGHPLIYATKILELLGADDRHAEDLFCALTLRIVSSTREDTLPPMKRWRQWVDAHELRPGTRVLSESDVQELAGRILDPADRAIEADLLDQISGETASASLLDVLVLAAAERLLRFDPSIHDDWTVQDTWLSATHLLTHAHAIREALAHGERPELLVNLVWSLAFIRRSHRLDLPHPPASRPVPATLDDIVAALDHRDRRVVALAHGWLEAGGASADLEPRLHRWLLRSPATVPIFVAHQIKTLRVALQEARLKTPLLGVLRYLAHPVAERGTHGDVHDAVQLVIHGRLPRLRAS